MKASEIMIGNFLRYKQDFPHPHLKGKIVKVCGIRGRLDVRTIDDGFLHDSEHPDWLEPIPITPEILEKNGFEQGYIGDSVLWWETCIEGNTIKFEYKGAWSLTIFREGQIQFYIRRLENIHQLQAALRLCGIEKEIVL